MPSSISTHRLRPRAVSRGVMRVYRERATEMRVRREHDEAIARDPRFELEHGLQVARSVEQGSGGCPYCPE